jgi:phosphoglycerol transferase MdoB-like AlkP superfamily enzyme
MSQFFNLSNSPVGFFGPMGFVFFILVIWSLIWKGLALWKAARQNSKVWFVILLVINTFGILEILYLYVLSDNEKERKEDINKTDNMISF